MLFRVFSFLNFFFLPMWHLSIFTFWTMEAWDEVKKCDALPTNWTICSWSLCDWFRYFLRHTVLFHYSATELFPQNIIEFFMFFCSYASSKACFYFRSQRNNLGTLILSDMKGQILTILISLFCSLKTVAYTKQGLYNNFLMFDELPKVK